MSLPWVRRSRLDVARLKIERLTQQVSDYRNDHFRHCACHDSWDQCPCSEAGHPADGSCDCCPLGTGLCGPKPEVAS